LAQDFELTPQYYLLLNTSTAKINVFLRPGWLTY
jgi:hypothetical protein